MKDTSRNGTEGGPDATEFDNNKKSKKKKKHAPLTPVERMEEMALTSRVTEALTPHLQGLTDKTLSEFIIHLTEQQLKEPSQRNDGTGSVPDVLSATRAGWLGTEILREESQELKARLTENGAPDLPLSLCNNLLEWVQSQSPRIK